MAYLAVSGKLVGSRFHFRTEIGILPGSPHDRWDSRDGYGRSMTKCCCISMRMSQAVICATGGRKLRMGTVREVGIGRAIPFEIVNYHSVYFEEEKTRTHIPTP